MTQSEYPRCETCEYFYRHQGTQKPLHYGICKRMGFTLGTKPLITDGCTNHSSLTDDLDNPVTEYTDEDY